MKIVFIFAFVLLCGLVLTKEERTNFQEKEADVADPKRRICKSIVHTMNSIFLFSLNLTVIHWITQRKRTKLLGFSTQ